MAAVSGDLNTIGVPRLFRVVADEKRTGLLTLTRPLEEVTERALIYFRDGDPYHTRLEGSGVKLGARLVSAGFVSHEDIDAALDIQGREQGQRRLGQILVDAGFITGEQLANIVRQQMEDTVFEILKWEGGEFSFEPGVEAHEDTELQVSVENLIMEGARRFREWHQITRRIPTLDSIPHFVEGDDAVEVALTAEEWALVSRVDGSATISDLAAHCGFTDLEAARTVFGLVTAGLLEAVPPEGVELAEYDPSLEKMFDELEKALEEAATHTSSQDSMTLEELAAPAAPEDARDEEPSTEGDSTTEAQKEPAVASEMLEAPVETTAEEAPILEAETEEEPLVRAEAEEEPWAQAETEEEGVEAEPIELHPGPLPLEIIDSSPAAAPTPEAGFGPPEDEQIPEEAAYDAPVVGEELPVAAAEELHSVVEESHPAVEELEPAQVLSEEKVEAHDNGYSFTSIAREFADLSRPFDEPNIRREPHKPEAHDEESDSDPGKKEAPRKPDPSVDVSSLIREFSSLDADDDRRRRRS